jgi:putative transposase
MKYWVIREIAKENWKKNKVIKPYSIEKMCQYLKVSRSGYYQWCQRGESARKKKERELKEKILAIYIEHNKRYGSPRIHDQLHDEGIRCSK